MLTLIIKQLCADLKKCITQTLVHACHMTG